MVSCTSPAVEEQEEKAAPEPEVSGKVIYGRLLAHWDFSEGDILSQYGGGGLGIRSAISDSLIDKDHDAKIVPALAESWQFSNNGLTLEFTLRKGVKFHNGDPFTAKDVKFTLEMLMSEEKKSIYMSEMRRMIEDIEVVDDYHITIDTKTPYLSFLDHCYDYWGIVPKDYYESVGAEEWAKHPVAAGPFKWVDYESDVFMEIEAVEDHYRHSPEFKTFRWVLVPEPSTLVAMLRTQEADLIDVPAEFIEELDADPDIRLSWANDTSAAQLVFIDLLTMDEPLPFHDVRVREAASLALDRATICDKVLHGMGRPYRGSVAPWQPGYDSELNKSDPYDPERARELLAEAGYADGFDTKLHAVTSSKSTYEAIAAYLNEVGIRAELVLADTGTHWQGHVVGKAPIGGLAQVVTTWSARAHTATSLDTMFNEKGAWCYVTLPEISAAVENMGKLMFGPELDAAASEVNQLIVDSKIRITLYASRGATALGPRIEYYERMAGHAYPAKFEYIRLKPEAK